MADHTGMHKSLTSLCDYTFTDRSVENLEHFRTSITRDSVRENQNLRNAEHLESLE